jgi:hypothetical protein
MNEGNLIPNRERSPNELREQARNGGIASGEARRQKRSYKEIAETVLSLRTTKESLHGNVEQMARGYDKDKDISIKAMLVMLQINKALQGDAKAFELIRDTIEGNPKGKQKEHKTYSVASAMSRLQEDYKRVGCG